MPLSVFRRISCGDLMDLLPTELLRRYAGWIAGFAEEAVEASRRHDPEQQQFAIRIGEAMPSVPGNEYRSALPKRVLCIVQCENSAAFQNVEGFVHPKVSVYRNAHTDRHLLGIARADYLNSVAYLRAISLTCSRVSCFGGTPGGLQVSRKKPSKPGGAMIQSRSSS